MAIKVGLVTVSDPRDEVYCGVAPFVMDSHTKLIGALEANGLEVIHGSTDTRSKPRVLEDVRRMVSEGAESVIFYFPAWGPSDIVATASRKLGKPVLLLTNTRPEYAGLVGLTLSGGALDQIGVRHKRVYGEIDDPVVMKQVLDFCKAAHVISELSGSTFGCFGGRTLGMYIATGDLAQWQRKFGIDIEHMDELSIIREAENVRAEDVARHCAWLRDHVGHVDAGSPADRSKLELQVRCYLALKRLVRSGGFRFVGVRCIGELSDHYVSQCIAVALMNDPYDADGPKEPTVCACEVDHDGALTMQILKLVSGGQPSCLMDVRHVEIENSKPVYTFCNCGAHASWFAARSEDPSENMKHVHLLPQIQGAAGGFATQFVCAPGRATLARLCRKEGKHWMAVLSGEVVVYPRERLRRTAWPWPHAFVRLNVPPREFISTFGSNHIHMVYGEYESVLEDVCSMLDIPCVRYG